MTTILLHGFWGQPKDWNDILMRLPLGANVVAPDLYEPGPLAPTTVLPDWTRAFWSWVDHEVGDSAIELIGYSMGARLALHAVMAMPPRVNRALLISGNPVLSTENHAEREQWEKNFAQRFMHEDWSVLERAWQDQPVFAHSPPVERRKTPALREWLGLSMLNWSPRRHPFGWSEVRALPSSVDWAFGALDQNYTTTVKSLQELPVRGQISVVPNVGHRVIQEAPEMVVEWMRREQ